MTRIAVGVAGSAEPLSLSSSQRVATSEEGLLPSTTLRDYVQNNPEGSFKVKTIMAVEHRDSENWQEPDEVEGLIWVRNESVTFIAQETT